MGKTILELFKSKKLDTGTTASEKYDIRNSKDTPVSSASGILSPSFGLLNKLRQSGLSIRDRETFVEQETTGLRPLRALSEPQLYGTEILRITRRSTNMLDDMKNGTYKDGDKNRIVGVGIYKIKEKAKTLASKIGIAFPEELIPTRLKWNSKFNTGENGGGEPNTMSILAEIKGDAAGNLVGKFLAQNVKGTPKQIGNAVVGNLIQLGKNELRKQLIGGRKEGQQLLAEKDENQIQYDSKVKYTSTIDATAEEASRNDLSSYLQRTQTSATVSNLGDKLTEIGIGNRGVPLKRVKKSYNEANLIQSIESKQKIARDGIALNQKNHYIANDDDVNKDYDDLDFITVKFTSIPTGKAVNFLATITGITENVTPTWDSNKFLGSPFDYYTYSGISRGVTFNLKLFSLNAKEHVVMWEKINLLTSFTYPAEYANRTYVIPPFLKLTIGDLYKSKECFIESLTYTVDDTAGWEIGTNYSTYGVGGGTSITTDGRPNSIDKGLNNYKLPLVIDVSVTVKFVETKANTISNFYGFNSVMPKNIIQKIEQKESPQNTSKQEVSPTDISKQKVLNPITKSNKATRKVAPNKEIENKLISSGAIRAGSSINYRGNPIYRYKKKWYYSDGTETTAWGDVGVKY